MPYHFEHIAMFYWNRYLNTASPSERHHAAHRYDTYKNLAHEFLN